MAIQTIISTLRHAHTAYNSEKRYAGTIDIGLSDLGIRDAQLASVRLKKMSYDVVITSELRRAFETAKIIFDGSTPIVKNQLCNERNFGNMQGLTWDEIQNLTPPILMIKVGNDLHTVNPKSGEPFEDVWKRANMFYHSILREHMGQNILVVSHGVFLQMFHGVIRGSNCIESLAVYPHNMQLTRFYISGVNLVEEQTDNIVSYRKGNW